MGDWELWKPWEKELSGILRRGIGIGRRRRAGGGKPEGNEGGGVA